MDFPPSHYLIIDLEATCCNRGTVPREEMEIIEIGAVMVNAVTMETETEFGTFVKPVRNPVLTSFCKELTSITQVEVDAAPGFLAAMQKLQAWMGPFPDHRFSSWGGYDRTQFVRDCTWHRLPYPFPEGHLNLKKTFAEAMGLKKHLGMAEAVALLGLKLEGTHHRGMDDARNMARIFRQVGMGKMQAAAR